MDHLSAAQARRIALAAQGFATPRPAGRVDKRHVQRVLDQIGVLQIDSVNVLTRSHELPLFARLGAYPRPLLGRLAYRDRAVFEYWGHMASYNLVETHPLLRWRMAYAKIDESEGGQLSRVEREHPGYVESVYEEVRDRGGIAASELTNGGTRKGHWWGWADGKSALEFLFWAGRLAATDRRPTFERVYDIAERVLPAEILARPTPSMEEAQRELLRRVAWSLGVATGRDLADYYRIRMPMARPRIAELVEDGSITPVSVEGWTDPGYLAPGARVPRRVSARALLSPFDSLIWDRARTERLFGMRLRIEIYTPAPKRIYGYYVLPFLLGDQLVARVDLKADRAASTLLVPAAYLDGPATAEEVVDELAAELRLMAEWLGLERIQVANRGDLAPALRRALCPKTRSGER